MTATRLLAGAALALVLAAGCSEIPFPYSSTPEAPPVEAPAVVDEATPEEIVEDTGVTADAIAALLASETRVAQDQARDEARRPGGVLAFGDLSAGDVVADLEPGGGYYTRLLAPLVGPEGHVYAVHSPYVAENFPDAIDAVAQSAAALGNVTQSTQAFDEMDIGAELDGAWMVLFYHDTVWQETDRAEMNRRIFDALRPGGTFLVIDHHAEPASGDRDVQTLHRIDAALVRGELEAAGFVLEAESDALSHPEDDLSQNVFEEGMRGQTDRFVYRFRKPE